MTQLQNNVIQINESVVTNFTDNETKKCRHKDSRTEKRKRAGGNREKGNKH